MFISFLFFVFTSALVSFLISIFLLWFRLVSIGFDFVFVLFRLRFHYSISAFQF